MTHIVNDRFCSQGAIGAIPINEKENIEVFHRSIIMAALTKNQQRTLLWVKALVKIKMRIMIEKLKLWDTMDDI